MIEALAKLAAGNPSDSAARPSGVLGDAVGSSVSTGFYKPEAPSEEKLGPVERTFDDWAKKLLGDGAAYDHYSRYRNFYNTGVPLAALGGAAFIGNSIDRGNNQGNGGGTNWASWLLPLGLVAGGLYAWNKYGDSAMDWLKNVKSLPEKADKTMKDASDAANEVKALTGRANKELDNLKNEKRYWLWRADRMSQRVGQDVQDIKNNPKTYGALGTPEHAKDANRQRNINDLIESSYKLDKYGRPIRDDEGNLIPRTKPKMTISEEARKQEDPAYMQKVHDQVNKSYSYTDAFKDTYRPVVGWLENTWQQHKQNFEAEKKHYKDLWRKIWK